MDAVKFYVETYVSAYSPTQWTNKLHSLGFTFEKLGNLKNLNTDWFVYRRNASLEIEFESTHQLVNFVKDLGTTVKIVPMGGGEFKIVVKDK